MAIDRGCVARARTTATRDGLRSKRGPRAGRWPARCTSLGASALAPLRSSPRGLQPLLLDKVHNRHDRGRLRQLDAQLLHDRTEVRQELIERLLALPDIENLKLAIFTEACVEFHSALRGPGLTEKGAPH